MNSVSRATASQPPISKMRREVARARTHGGSGGIRCCDRRLAAYDLIRGGKSFYFTQRNVNSFRLFRILHLLRI